MLKTIVIVLAVGLSAVRAETFPNRIHVFEDYETEIEERWWLRGVPERKNLPPSLSKSVPNTRACRAAPSKNFDRKMGDQTKEWKAVIFNPVPGPPMGKNTRLSFRYWLKGTDTLRVQIFSLSKGYHRFLTLNDLENEKWQAATVDMTKARRPDGSGGALSEDERIDDIQFYVNPEAELVIDDIVLFDAAPEDEVRGFPSRVIFTGWFDTGKHGKEWPGEFEIVRHEKPRTWDAIRAVEELDADGTRWARVHLRGDRLLSKRTELRFKYRIEKRGAIRVVVGHSKTGELQNHAIATPLVGRWREHRLVWEFAEPKVVDQITFRVPAKAGELRLDDVILYEPATSSKSRPGELICCGGAEVFIVDPSKEPPEKIWSWRANEEAGLPADLVPRFRTTADCKPVDGGAKILIASSSGGIALVERASGKVGFHATVGNAHSIEWLPGDRIAVAGSTHRTGNCVAIFDANTPAKELFRDRLYSGHGLYWDRERKVLWALGYDELRAYGLADWETAKPRLERKKTFSLPDESGHDLSPITMGDSEQLIVTTNPSVWRFDPNSERFHPFKGLASEAWVKSVDVHPKTGDIAVVQASKEAWWTDLIQRFRPSGALTLQGERLYKVRWLR